MEARLSASIAATLSHPGVARSNQHERLTLLGSLLQAVTSAILSLHNVCMRLCCFTELGSPAPFLPLHAAWKQPLLFQS